ncbi:antibiotic biosynthesis monooxygenase [Serratia ureilytica]
MPRVIAEDFIHPEHIATVIPWYRELVEKTRQEPCASVMSCVSTAGSRAFIFIESWPDRAARCALPDRAFTRLVPQINQHQRKPCTFLFMAVFPETGDK